MKRPRTTIVIRYSGIDDSQWAGVETCQTARLARARIKALAERYRGTRRFQAVKVTQEIIATA